MTGIVHDLEALEARRAAQQAELERTRTAIAALRTLGEDHAWSGWRPARPDPESAYMRTTRERYAQQRAIEATWRRVQPPSPGPVRVFECACLVCRSEGGTTFAVTWCGEDAGARAIGRDIYAAVEKTYAYSADDPRRGRWEWL
jgi:hypothetical protein